MSPDIAAPEMPHEEAPPAEDVEKEVEEAEKEGSVGSDVVKVVEHDRGAGVSTVDYMITLMGYAIGIGNLWRFPYLVGTWGGGSFIVAYLVCLVLVATPMYLVELHWGQYTRMNTIECFKVMHPRWIGIAVTGALMVIFINMYYNMLLAYACVYLVGSFYSPLPWTADALGDTGNVSASEYYWRKKVLNQYDSQDIIDNNFDGPGELQWRLVLGLLFVWAVVYLALFKGIEASAKVSYVTVGLPIVCLLIMLIRAVTLDGAGDGIEFYIGKFDGEKLYDGEMWATACGQILFSLSPGMGTAVTLSSYSRPNEDVYRVNYLVTICNSAFSITGGFAVFSILGFMAKRSCEDPTQTCTSVDDLASSSGAGLAFMTLAEGVSQFGDGSNVFSVLFFLMLLTLGLDSTFAWIETLNTYAADYSKKILGTPLRKELVAAVTAIFFILTGLPFCTRLGFTLLDVVDHFAATHVLIFAIMMQSIMLWTDWSWELIRDGIKNATKGSSEFPEGRDVWIGWRFAIFGTAPVISFTLFWYLVIEDFKEPYGDYPEWLQAFGWIVLVIVLLPTFVFFAIFFKAEPAPLPGKKTKHYDDTIEDNEMPEKKNEPMDDEPADIAATQENDVV